MNGCYSAVVAVTSATRAAYFDFCWLILGCPSTLQARCPPYHAAVGALVYHRRRDLLRVVALLERSIQQSHIMLLMLPLLLRLLHRVVEVQASVGRRVLLACSRLD